jgi:hypothetical protein
MSFVGIFLFIAAMFYVPMAQVHQAVTGDFRAFFDVRFVWRMIQARLTAYVGLAAFIALASVPLEIMKTAPYFFEAEGSSLTQLTDREYLQFLQRYLLGCCFYLFPALMASRWLAAAVYRSALVKVIDRGWVTRDQLHPVLVNWFKRLGLPLEPLAQSPGFIAAVRFSGRWVYRRLLYTALVAIWFAFVAKTYVGEFLNYHLAFEWTGMPVEVGFLNHPLVQLPSFDYVPQQLKDAAMAQP